MNPILEEVWRIKDELAREAGYDTRRFFENLRCWSAENPHRGPVVRTAEDLRRLAAQAESERAEASVFALNEAPSDMKD